MNVLEMKKQSELLKVTSAKFDMMVRISEISAEIDRLQAGVKIQEEKESQLREEITKLKGE